MKAFLIIYSVLYILLEIAFRTRLLETIGIVSDSSSIENIEIIGRLISSFGFAIFIASLIKLKNTNNIVRVLTFVVVYSLSFGGFFAAQKFIVDSIVSSMPNDLKEKAFYLQLYKENVYYGVVKSENFPYTMKNKDASQSKVFLANLSLLNIDNNSYIEYLIGNKASLIENSINYGLDDYGDAVVDEWYTATSKLNNSYDKFEDAQKSISRKIKSIDKNSKESFDLIDYYKAEEFRGYRNYILSIYATGGYLSAGKTNAGIDFHVATKTAKKIYDRSSIFAGISYDSKGTLTVKKNARQSLLHHDNGVYPRYEMEYSHIKFNKSDVKSKEDLSLFIKKFENVMLSRIYDELKLKLEMIDESLGYKYSDSVKDKLVSLSQNLCNKYEDANAVKRVSGINVSDYDEQLIVLSEGRVIKRLTASDNSGFTICSFDSKTSELKLILKDIANKFNKAKFGFNRDYSNPSDFHNTEYFRKMLQKELKYKKMDIPLNFNSKSYYDFKKYYTKSIYDSSADRLTYLISSFVNMKHSDYIKEYGYVKLNINEKQLYELPAIKKELKASMPFLYDNNGNFMHVYRTDDYNVDSYIDKIPTIKNNFAREKKKFLNDFAKAPIENQEVLDNYGKALVVPPFVLLVSTIMIVVNLVNLFWKIVPIKNTKIKLTTNVLFLALIVLLPLSFSNPYVQTKYYERLAGHGKSHSYLMTTVWLQNTKVLFDKSYSVGKVFNPLIDLFEYKILLSGSRNGDANIRKRNLSKKIKG
jgi:hypothetical protein